MITEHARGIGFALKAGLFISSGIILSGSGFFINFYFSFSQKLKGASLNLVIYADYALTIYFLA
jgi:hypothetical protein